jgi:ring-1,2-phenylacetyl-CoA epoxidase subunit PaaC
MTKDQALFNYLLRLADSSLILSQRLAECCGHGPILEEDIALTNSSLDLLGHATSVLTYAGKLEAGLPERNGKGRSEDELAFLRSEREFRNVLLAEQPNGDFACILTRQFLFDCWQFYLYESLQKSKDETLAALSAKFSKEITYHLRHSSEWMLRLGDGTLESHERMQNAMNELWMFTGDLFGTDEADALMLRSGIGADLTQVKVKWEKHVAELLSKATLMVPSGIFMQSGSLQGKHTEHLGFMLAEMQYLPRTYTDSKW